MHADGFSRRLMRETTLTTDDLICPLFVHEGSNEREPIASMPGVERLSIDLLVDYATELHGLGIPAVAVFPVTPNELKTDDGRESYNPDGLAQRAISAIKARIPELRVITDVALDPFTTHGHDGIIRNGYVDNDETLKVLVQQALVQANAGCSVIAPSDMMDGRVGAIRTVLDAEGFSSTSIMAYAAKYASAFYGPFREASDSAPSFGDRHTYQLDPANVREAIREVGLDVAEGADLVMVKPALPYLDVVARVRATDDVPIAAYLVSGEFAAIKAAAARGWLNEKDAALEVLTSISRAGADVIITYWAPDVAVWLDKGSGS